MNVLQVITSGEAGGAQSHVLALCETVRNDVQLSVAMGYANGAVLADQLGHLGIPVHALAELRNSTNPLAVWRASKRLEALMRELRPDVVHAHSSFAGSAARIAANRCGIPVVYTVHGFGFKPQARPGVREAAWIAEALLAPRTSHMICVSQHEAGLARRLPFAPRAISVIANGLPDVSERATPDADPLRVIMVARLAAPKRPDLLLDALALVPGAPPVQIVGDGPDRAALEARADRLGLRGLEFAGVVSDVARRLAEHSVFVLLSDHEGLPISVIEAMRAGLAIVATRLPGIEEMVRDGESALLVDNDPQVIARALQRLQAEPALRAQLGRGARARYEAEFDARAMGQRVLDVYRSLA